jgi:hypothetical protein
MLIAEFIYSAFSVQHQHSAFSIERRIAAERTYWRPGGRLFLPSVALTQLLKRQ